MKVIKLFKLLVIITALTAASVSAQTSPNEDNNMEDPHTMKTYLIEREIPNAGALTQEELKGISQKSNEVVSEMGPQIKWLHSYVTDNKVYCVYKAQNEEVIKRHAEKGGFPVNAISELSTKINPSTAEE
ncbi:MAG: DUF4242 domain-containing protein [Cyclobacteriaceae bacterium]